MKRKYFIAFSVQKSVSRNIRDKISLFLQILLDKLRISNFEMWRWDVIFGPFSEKVSCTANAAAALHEAANTLLRKSTSKGALGALHHVKRLLYSS